ncbi:hypothetical protein J437_LFUL005153 [Ladona fulva]|uniref:Uncharacterized protein n=1 Tax=Ladona fulva TaxID=123851 RepID=A0A8K0P5L9_LADFU|nr:hypothetical protein J437_LFUL005153 [Ladona fulva]
MGDWESEDALERYENMLVIVFYEGQLHPVALYRAPENYHSLLPLSSAPPAHPAQPNARVFLVLEDERASQRSNRSRSLPSQGEARGDVGMRSVSLKGSLGIRQVGRPNGPPTPPPRPPTPPAFNPAFPPIDPRKPPALKKAQPAVTRPAPIAARLGSKVHRSTPSGTVIPPPPSLPPPPPPVARSGTSTYHVPRAQRPGYHVTPTPVPGTPTQSSSAVSPPVYFRHASESQMPLSYHPSRGLSEAVAVGGTRIASVTDLNPRSLPPTDGR